MKARRLAHLLLYQALIHGDCEVRIEIQTPTALDPTFSAVASEPQDVVWQETGNSPPVITIMDWRW